YDILLSAVSRGLRDLHPFPTRRTSDLGHLILVPWLFGWEPLGGDVGFAKTFDVALHMGTLLGAVIYFRRDLWRYLVAWLTTLRRDRKSTRLNSSHVKISYAVFCLKKKI